MEASEDENISAAICRRVSSGKRYHQRKCKQSQQHEEMNDSHKESNSSKKKWIGKSLIKKQQDTMKQTHIDGSGDSLDTSDLLMAQIDVDNLIDANDGFGSPQCKMICLSETPKKYIDKPKNSPSLLSKNCFGDDSCDSKYETSLLAEQDLFDDSFDDIFFPSRESLSQPCVVNKFENKECTHDNTCDKKRAYCVTEQSTRIKGFESVKIGLENNITTGNIQTKNNDVVLTTPLPQHKDTQQSGSLKERLKQRLQKNAITNPTSPGIELKLKQEAMSKARVDASQIRKEGTKVDIGPFYGLPSKVQDLFQSVKGIKELYDWQDECLNLHAIKERKNLIYTLPTSGGKTLVAEVLILRELLCYKRDALLVLPFVSIVQEKVRGISEFATDLGFLVEEYAGSRGKFPPLKRRKMRSLYIATIEKAHSLVNSLIETDRLDSLGLVVVDELHMLGEGGSRGAVLESALMKILHSKVEIQIIGMSATLNNISDLQKFLSAEIYSNNFRPVSLQEYVKVEDNLFSVNPKALCKDDQLEHSRITMFPYSSEILKRDPDQLLGLVMEVIPDNSCLVFCSTKKNCESVALMLSELICKHKRHLVNTNKARRKELLQELHRSGNSKICPTLSYTVHFGIAYHHSGLTMDERQLIEEAYGQGTLCLLACTSTLAAGVNLPAKRVILRSPYVGMEFIKYSQYKQMTGRAGRAGIDSSGESILIAKKQDRFQVRDLLAGPKDYCHSSLMYDDGKGIQSLLLSSIGLRIICTTDSAFNFMANSLLSIQCETLKINIAEVCKEALQYLVDQSLVIQVSKTKDDGNEQFYLDVTSLGKATFKGSVNHVYSSQLYKDLNAGEDSLVLSNHFHLLYLVTPYDVASNVMPAWDLYYKKFCQLSETEIHIAKLVGISESYLSRRSVGLSSRQKIDTLATNRFYLTLMLWDLWNQRTIWDVAEHFQQSRGFVQNLLTSASAFASCVHHFCQELEEFWAYQDLLGNVVKRLSYCVKAELIPLMEVPGILIARAKQLYAVGICSLAALANAEADDLVKKIEHLSRRNARQIISAAKNLVEEKTAILMEEVETLITVTTSTDT